MKSKREWPRCPECGKKMWKNSNDVCVCQNKDCEDPWIAAPASMFGVT